MAAQILSSIALLFSWVWWVTFLLSLVGTVSFLMLWCKRLSTRSIYAYVWMARVIAVCQFGLALYCWVALRRKKYCHVFEMSSDDNYYYGSYDWWDDDCSEKGWGFLSFVCSLLWAVCSLCLAKFVHSGRHAKLEDQYSPGSSSENKKQNSSNGNDDDDEKTDEEIPGAIELIPEAELIAKGELLEEAYNYNNNKT